MDGVGGGGFIDAYNHDAHRFFIHLLRRCELCKAQPHRSCRYYIRLSICDIIQIQQLYMETNKENVQFSQTHRDRASALVH